MSTLIPNAPPDNRSDEAKIELEYGSLQSPEFLYVSKHPAGQPLPTPVDDEPPYYVNVATLLSFLFLIIIGHIRDFFGKIFKPYDYADLIEKDGYAPWYDGFENFYVRRLKTRLDDCFARPTHGVPGRYINCFLRQRAPQLKYTYNGESTKCLNLSSYNYLGFAQSHGVCTDYALKTVEKYGTSACSPRSAAGTLDKHKECEQVIADFVGKEDSLIVSQGYGTNASVFALMVDSQCLVLSDSLNHASIRFGIRLSGAVVKPFEHNDMRILEKIIRNEIAQGQPRTHRPWKKIIIAVEGLYSMEGNLVNLPEIVALKDKYKCYLFLDEAHSIGAMGPNGRGVCDFFLVDPKKIDIMMGTFTKSFGATGGYIAADKWIIDRLRISYFNSHFGESVPPAVLGQIISSLSVIKGTMNPGEGQERLQRIAFNSRYLRLGLKRLGFIVYGADDSPVIPLLLYLPAKMPAISRKLYAKKIAVVVVGYPATPITTSRVRLCVSSALTKDDLDYVLEQFSEVGDELFMKYRKDAPRMKLEDVLKTNAEDCKRPGFV
ncbi:hypothetical protein PUMCH_000793 [Australozyma saopauloensis]|uniref:serine C-palmitoyltransferase n=1 Tax=Australozyma saopauloensis TaxID=291208 RepID=A0AAX4H4S2_9ASCO|nr:hypothetical protein PUMCH_000793 [[Candida] saopauloensis]